MDGNLILKLLILFGCGLDVLLCILSLALPRWLEYRDTSKEELYMVHRNEMDQVLSSMGINTV